MTDSQITVFYDGSCPICRREIFFYQKLDKRNEINWLDATDLPTGEVVSGLTREEALQRFHVRLGDGRVISGGRAFAVLWEKLPPFKLLGKVCSVWPMCYLIDFSYDMFLIFRPKLQKIFRRSVRLTHEKVECYPPWLRGELRSDHAGEVGAVNYYRGILAFASDKRTKDFANKHLKVEKSHLKRMEILVPKESRTIFLPIWRSLGYLGGAISALLGFRGVVVATAEIESFVVMHYKSQIVRLSKTNTFNKLTKILEELCDDEEEHRDEALTISHGHPNFILKIWCSMLRAGSKLAVAVSRRF